MPQRLLVLLCALLTAMLLMPHAFAEEETAEEENVFVQPTLPPDAIRYDSAHPDILEPDMLYARSAILIEASTARCSLKRTPTRSCTPPQPPRS